MSTNISIPGMSSKFEILSGIDFFKKMFWIRISNKKDKINDYQLKLVAGNEQQSIIGNGITAFCEKRKDILVFIKYLIHTVGLKNIIIEVADISRLTRQANVGLKIHNELCKHKVKMELVIQDKIYYFHDTNSFFDNIEPALQYAQKSSEEKSRIGKLVASEKRRKKEIKQFFILMVKYIRCKKKFFPADKVISLFKNLNINIFNDIESKSIKSMEKKNTISLTSKYSYYFTCCKTKLQILCHPTYKEDCDGLSCYDVGLTEEQACAIADSNDIILSNFIYREQPLNNMENMQDAISDIEDDDKMQEDDEDSTQIQKIIDFISKLVNEKFILIQERVEITKKCLLDGKNFENIQFYYQLFKAAAISHEKFLMLIKNM